MCCLFAQVAARLAAESGSICSVGLLPPAAAVKAEIAAFLAARQAGQPSSRATCTTATPAAASAAAPGVAGAPPNSRPPVAASTHSTHGQQLLPSGCPAVAASVYTSLLTWLQDQQQQNQQQQQQQPSASETDARVQEAAVATAALAPALLTGVFKEQNKLAVGGDKLVRPCCTAASYSVHSSLATLQQLKLHLLPRSEVSHSRRG
jgi:hypothetical protein